MNLHLEKPWPVYSSPDAAEISELQLSVHVPITRPTQLSKVERRKGSRNYLNPSCPWQLWSNPFSSLTSHTHTRKHTHFPPKTYHPPPQPPVSPPLLTIPLSLLNQPSHQNVQPQIDPPPPHPPCSPPSHRLPHAQHRHLRARSPLRTRRHQRLTCLSDSKRHRLGCCPSRRQVRRLEVPQGPRVAGRQHGRCVRRAVQLPGGVGECRVEAGLAGERV